MTFIINLTADLVVRGSIVDEIIGHSEGAVAIVLGTRRHSAAHDLVAGNVEHGVLNRATVPVLVVPLKAAKSTRAGDAAAAR